MRFKGESPVELNYFDLKEVSVVLHVQRLYCKQWCYYVFVAFEYHRISLIMHLVCRSTCMAFNLIGVQTESDVFVCPGSCVYPIQ